MQNHDLAQCWLLLGINEFSGYVHFKYRLSALKFALDMGVKITKVIGLNNVR